MKIGKLNSLTLLKTITCAALALSFVALAQAKETPPDPTGTWVWTNHGRNGGADTTNTLTLKYTGGSLTGTLDTPKKKGGTTSTEISDGKVTDDKISFNVSREACGNTVTMGYAGTVTGDAITGTIETERNGEKHSPRKWEAKRQGEAVQTK